MSDPKQGKTKRQFSGDAPGEYISNDDSITNHGNMSTTSVEAVDMSAANKTTTTASTTLGTDTDSSSMNHSIPPLHTLLLPDGQIMDAKNTLQSFATPSTSTTISMPSTHESPSSPKFTLSDGRIIDGKNTLQSFAAVPSPARAAAATKSVST